MSYCRWQNTASDLDDCVDSLDGLSVEKLKEALSREEWRAFCKICHLAQDIVEYIEDTDIVH